MTLEQEMKLWETRSNDAFGQYLTSVENNYKEFYAEEETEYGFNSNPVSNLRTLYAVDGDARNIYKRVRNLIEDYELDNLTFDVESFIAA